jgi:hypothetical protein
MGGCASLLNVRVLSGQNKKIPLFVPTIAVQCCGCKRMDNCMENGNIKTESFDLRLTVKEKQGFREAANISGLPLSAWVRERLRFAAIRELEKAGRQIPFVEPVPLGGSDE